MTQSFAWCEGDSQLGEERRKTQQARMQGSRRRRRSVQVNQTAAGSPSGAGKPERKPFYRCPSADLSHVLDLSLGCLCDQGPTSFGLEEGWMQRMIRGESERALLV